MKRLENKVAIITGGSRGIGKAVASLFTREGANVVVAARDRSEIDKTVEELRKKGGRVEGVKADVSCWSDVIKVVMKTLRFFETIDILVNCAAIQKPIGSFLDTDMVQWIENIKINLLGTVMCCKAVLPIMIKNDSGKIINFSGGGAVSPRTNFSAYATSKAAVVRFTETLSTELGDYNINVNAVAPGVIRTRMIEEAIRAGEKVKPESEGTPENASELVLFLSCKDSNSINGRLISAVWDNWKNMDKIDSPSLYTLRRIDGRNFKGM